MAIQKIDHMYVETRDFDRAIEFWSSLGFEVKQRWGEDGHQACRLEAGEAQIVLAEEKEKPVVPTFHFALEDATAFHEKLAKADAVEITTPLQDTHWGTQWIRVKDPDGNEYALEVYGKA